MRSFKVTILGSAAALPAYKRHPSAQVLNINEQLYLLDCGEGTQMQMNKYRIKRHKINHIFITHLHGDHYLGLLGFLDSLHLSGRTKPMHLYAPAKLQKIIQLHHEIVGGEGGYELIFHTMTADKSRIILDDANVCVRTVILDHRVPCTGYIFQEKNKGRKILADKIKTYNIPFPVIKDIKKGADFTTADGQLIPNHELTLDAPPTRTYAYCTDTKYTESILPIIRDVDLLYHEATYLNDFSIELTAARGHSTAEQAAQMAKKASAGHLLIGHFSARYPDLAPFLTESQAVFSNTHLAIEGCTFSLENGLKVYE